jgi:hypothetical protein
MERRAYAFGRQMTWQAVGKKYAELFVAIAQEYRRPWVFFASTPERRYPTGLTVVEKAGML